MGNPNYANGFKLATHENSLDAPLRWKKPQVIFVNSMSDLFHERVPLEFILEVFEIMNRASWHQYQVLTKRSTRLRELSGHLPWAPNIWMGVSVENEDYTYRIDDLRQTGALVKFISFEPFLGVVQDVHLNEIDWVIVGGESGPRARPMNEAWVIDIRDLCVRDGVPFFFKQWGGVNKKKAGRLLQGRTWDEMPCSATPECASLV